MRYSIRQVSERTGIRPYVLRYYEKEGLLPPVGRTKGASGIIPTKTWSNWAWWPA